MTPHEMAARLEHFARRVRSIRPADHRRPDIFFEDQSEVAAELMAEARELRTVPSLPAAKPAIVAGTREIRDRRVHVEVRWRA